MILLELKKRIYNVPQTWNELTGKQLATILPILENGIGKMERIALFKIMCGLTWWRMWRIGGDAINDALYLTDFLLGENMLTTNTLPIYKGTAGPGDNFSNVRTSEFAFTEYHYQLYKEQQSIADLNSLIAILYRPLKKGYDRALDPDGDCRQPFNDNVVKFYTRKVSRWPRPIKLVILHWYEGCRQQLQDENPEPYKGGGTEEPRYGLWSVMRMVAEKSIHGKMTEVGDLHIKVFMMELTEQIAEAQRLKELSKSNQHNG